MGSETKEFYFLFAFYFIMYKIFLDTFITFLFKIWLHLKTLLEGLLL